MDDQLSIEVEEVEGVRRVTITFAPVGEFALAEIGTFKIGNTDESH